MHSVCSQICTVTTSKGDTVSKPHAVINSPYSVPSRHLHQSPQRAGPRRRTLRSLIIEVLLTRFTVQIPRKRKATPSFQNRISTIGLRLCSSHSTATFAHMLPHTGHAAAARSCPVDAQEFTSLIC